MEAAILAHDELVAEVAGQYVDEEKGVEMDDLMQEGRLAVFLLLERALTPVRPWHLKLVMRNWASHIRNPESAVPTETLVWAIDSGVQPD